MPHPNWAQVGLATRVVVVDETGRVYDRTGVGVEVHIQDDGLTLKVFVTPMPEEQAKVARLAQLQNFVEDIETYKNQLKGQS